MKQMKEERKFKQGLNDLGQEVPDPVPVAPPVGFKPTESLVDMIRRMVRSEQIAAELEAQGFESFADADDMAVDDDDEYDPSSPYEEVFEGPIDVDGELNGKPEAAPAPNAPSAAPAASTGGGDATK